MIYLITKQKYLFNSNDVIYLDSVDYLFEKFKDIDLLGCDTETMGFDPYTKNLLTIQIGNETDQFVIDVTTIDIQLIKEFLESKTLIFHNAKFDLKFLYHQRILPPNVRDTFIQEYLLTLGLSTHRRSLEAVADRYLKVHLNKSIRGLIHRKGLSYDVVKYSADDVKYLIPIYNQQVARLTEMGLLVAAKLENNFTKVLAYIEYSGMYLNKDKWLEKVKNDNIKLKKATDLLNTWILQNLPQYIDPQLNLFSAERVVNVNWNSSDQVVPIFKTLGINTTGIDKKTKEEKDSVEAKILQSQKDKSPLISLYLDYKESAKTCSVYSMNFINQIHPVTDRIHTQFQQLMKTGRLSSGGKDRENKLEYINFQNIPSDDITRACFTNSCESNTLINADYDSQEQRVIAEMSLEPDLLHFYDSGQSDMHGFIASKLFPELKDLSLSDIKKFHSDKRQIAKIAGFSINYGGNGFTISNNLSFPIEVGEKLYKDYFDAFPKLKEFFKKCGKQTLEDGYVLFNTITRHKSFIEYYDEFERLQDAINNNDFWQIYRDHKARNTEYFNNSLKPKVKSYFSKKNEIERVAVNWRIQGTGAAMMKIAAILFFGYLVEKNYVFKVYMSNKVHDEFLVETPIELAEELSIKLKECMETAGDVFCKRIKITATPKITNTWKH